MSSSYSRAAGKKGRTKMKRSLVRCGTAILLCLGSLGGANADIMYSFSASGTGDNVLFTKGQTGTTIVGTTQQSNTNVVFTGDGNETLATQANGQARLTASNFEFLDISLQAANTGFTTLVFNLNGVPHQTGGASITAFDQFGNSFVGNIASLGSGQNFVTVTASNGQIITHVNISTTGPIGDLEQVRLGGFQAVPVVQVLATPGPVVGGGLAGLLAACGALVGFARRRRSARS